MSLKRRILLPVVVLLAASLACAGPFSLDLQQTQPPDEEPARPSLRATVPEDASEQQGIPTFTPAAGVLEEPPDGEAATQEPDQAASLPPTGVEGLLDQNMLVRLNEDLNPGVVNIRVIAQQFGQAGEGAGSGFIIDDQGHIVTNNHVIEGATQVTVIFYNGFEAEAEIIGADAYSDLAVVRVGQLVEGAHPLPLGDSRNVRVGEIVVAIGNPFGANSSMSQGIVSAIERTIPSGATAFSIPEAIQTDAAINPGNSGGPLLNLAGEVIGVNAQIATGGVAASSGVGFAIPANVVRRVVPVLIERGSYEWPYMGVEGQDVNLIIQQANGLESQDGAYVHNVTPGGPAEAAGLQGSRGSNSVDGIEVPTGGDVIIAANGQPVTSFNDLLVLISEQAPGDAMLLDILRDGETIQLEVVLAPRP